MPVTNRTSFNIVLEGRESQDFSDAAKMLGLSPEKALEQAIREFSLKALGVSESPVPASNCPYRVEYSPDRSKISIICGYCDEFVKAAKSIGGKFCAIDKSWEFPVGAEDNLATMLENVFGYNFKNPPTEFVDVCFFVQHFREKEVYCAGKLVAKRPSRDHSVVLGDGVIVVEGSFPSRGGSHGNPLICPVNANRTLVVRVKGVPKPYAEKNDLWTCSGIAEVEEAIDSEQYSDAIRLIKCLGPDVELSEKVHLFKISPNYKWPL